MTGNELIKINLLPTGAPLPRGKSGFGLVSCLALLLLLVVLSYAGWLGYQEFTRVSTDDLTEDMSASLAIDPVPAETPAAPLPQENREELDTTEEQGTEQRVSEPVVPIVPEEPEASAPLPLPLPLTLPQEEPKQVLADRFQPLAEELARCLEEMRLAMDVGNYPAAADTGIKVLEALTEVGEMPAILQQFVDEIVWLRSMALQLQEREENKRQNPAFDLLPIRLEGVIWSPDKSLAFVNGSTLAIGDPVPGVEVNPPPLVEDIQRDRVRFHYRGATYEKKVELFGE